jgi:hypothetical protein
MAPTDWVQFGSAHRFCSDSSVAKRLKLLVEPRGFEPLTSAVRLRRSPN